MGIFTKRNALVGWATLGIGKRVAKRKAKRMAPSMGGKGAKAGAAGGAAAALAGLMFWRKRRKGNDSAAE